MINVAGTTDNLPRNKPHVTRPRPRGVHGGNTFHIRKAVIKRNHFHG
ncbi:hypothetical protein [Streptomyces sp. NPDC047070]